MTDGAGRPLVVHARPALFGLCDEERGEGRARARGAVEELRFVEVRTKRPRAASRSGSNTRPTRVDGRFDAPTLVLAPGLPDRSQGFARTATTSSRAGSRRRRRPARRRAGGASRSSAAGGPVRSRAGDRPLRRGVLDPGALRRLPRPARAGGARARHGRARRQVAVRVRDERARRGEVARPCRLDRRAARAWAARAALVEGGTPEGLPPELCIRNPDGVPVAVDPATRRRGRSCGGSWRRSSPPTASTPTVSRSTSRPGPPGRAVSSAGGAWGIALLHELLATVYAAAKEAKPDALVMTHTPHPGFVDVTDMIRLNDVLSPSGTRLPVVEQMELRAAVTRAACPELLIDTDDWPIGDLDTWRAYAERRSSSASRRCTTLSTWTGRATPSRPRTTSCCDGRGHGGAHARRHASGRARAAVGPPGHAARRRARGRDVAVDGLAGPQRARVRLGGRAGAAGGRGRTARLRRERIRPDAQAADEPDGRRGRARGREPVLRDARRGDRADAARGRPPDGPHLRQRGTRCRSWPAPARSSRCVRPA